MKKEKYVPLPQPADLSIREKEDAMGAYLMMFAAIGAGLPLPIFNLIASVIYFYINKSKSRFVKFHAHQSLLSQIPVSLLNSVAVFWAIRIIFWDYAFTDLYKGYLWMILIANITYFAFSLVGAIRARKGRFFYFVFFGKLSYAYAYKAGESTPKPDPVNLPPKI